MHTSARPCFCTGRAALQGKAGEEAREPSQLDLLLARLPGCVSKELADEVAVAFCYLQNKGARRRLARALAAELPLGALALLPFYARIAATLAQIFPDMAQGG
jgi:regulator of nonsense transcripts 2